MKSQRAPSLSLHMDQLLEAEADCRSAIHQHGLQSAAFHEHFRRLSREARTVRKLLAAEARRRRICDREQVVTPPRGGGQIDLEEFLSGSGC